MVVALIVGEFTAYSQIGMYAILICIMCAVVAACYGRTMTGFVIWLLMFSIGFLLFSEQETVFSRYDEIQYNEDSQKIIIEATGKIDSIEKKTYNYELTLNTADGVILLYMDNVLNIRQGEEIKAVGEIIPMEQSRNDGNFNQWEYLHSKGVILKLDVNRWYAVGDTEDYSQLKEGLRRVRQYFSEILTDICTEEERGLISAIVLGDTSDVDGDIKELYSLNGISHILAISGLHISLIGMTVYKLLRCRMRYLSSATVSSVIMVLFIVLTGNSVSSMRAVIMFLMHVIADVLGRKYDMPSSLSLAAILLLLKNPYYIFNASFQLTFLAMIAVCVVAPEVIDFIACKIKIVQSLVFNISLSVTMLPLNSRLFFRHATYAPILNLIVVPLMSIMFAMSVIGMIVGMWSRAAGEFAIGSAVYILKFYTFLCNVCKKLPYYSIVTGNISNASIVVAYICLGILVLIIRKKTLKDKKILTTVIVLVGIIFVIVFSDKNHGFKMYFLDVGQGDCTYIHSQEGNDYLIDCGSTDESNVGKYRLESFLEYMDVDTLEYVFVSHCDTDHVSGIIELIDRGLIKVENLVLPVVAKDSDNENYSELLRVAENRDVEIIYFQEGSSLKDGALEFTCVSPKIDKSYSDINEGSMVLFVKYEKLGAVFTGDIGSQVENELVAEIGELAEKSEYRILKVAHHGSKNSSTEEFLRAVSPTLSVISCGEDNSYGHPHKEVLERLENAESIILTTSQCGMVKIEIEKEVNVYEFKDK